MALRWRRRTWSKALGHTCPAAVFSSPSEDLPRLIVSSLVSLVGLVRVLCSAWSSLMRVVRLSRTDSVWRPYAGLVRVCGLLGGFV